MKKLQTAVLLMLIGYTPIVARQTISITTANSLKAAGNLKAAIEQYTQLQHKLQDKWVVYELADAYVLDGQYDSALTCLIEALSADLSFFYCGLHNFINTLDHPRWLAVEERYEMLLQQEHITEQESIVLAKQLWKMGIKDQAYYYHLNLLEKGSRYSPLKSIIWDWKLKINKENQQQLAYIIANHGWPEKTKAGIQGATAAFLIIQHASLAMQKRCLPLLKAACQIGEADWRYYAMMFDRIAVFEDRKQLYGTQLEVNEATNEYKLHIEDPDNVNKRRAQMNLPPIEDYLAQWGISWKDYLKKQGKHE